MLTSTEQGCYEPVAEALPIAMSFVAYFAEWSDGRSVDFKPQRFSPIAKIAVRGLVTVKLAGWNKTTTRSAA